MIHHAPTETSKSALVLKKRVQRKSLSKVLGSFGMRVGNPVRPEHCRRMNGGKVHADGLLGIPVTLC